MHHSQVVLGVHAANMRGVPGHQKEQNEKLDQTREQLYTVLSFVCQACCDFIDYNRKQRRAQHTSLPETLRTVEHIGTFAIHPHTRQNFTVSDFHCIGKGVRNTCTT